MLEQLVGVIVIALLVWALVDRVLFAILGVRDRQR
jgi:hypothetical protein